MTKSPLGHKTPVSDTSANLSTIRVMLDFVDTAWRIAIPVVLFAGAGIFIDKKVGSEPWITLLGVVVGFVVAGLLVKQQLMAAVMPTKPKADIKDTKEQKDV